MIPQVLEDLKGDFTFAALPSRTFRMRHDTRSIVGTVDQIKAVEQAIFLILNVERYEWLIYSWNYGVELKQLFGKPADFCIPEIERCIREALLSRMLQKALSVNSNLDTREGSLVWLGNAPAAVELRNLYIALDTVLNETFADTASREMLIKRAAERGIVPLPATPAVLELSVTPTSLALPMGTRFSIGAFNYFVSAAGGDGNYEITCETAGEAGNEYGAAVLPIEFIIGNSSITFPMLSGSMGNFRELPRLSSRSLKTLGRRWRSFSTTSSSAPLAALDCPDGKSSWESSPREQRPWRKDGSKF